MPIGSGLDGIERDEADLGPNGGPKHWTDGEKDTLFHWLLDNDKNWDMFRSKMNTVFRDVRVFGLAISRVLKGCCAGCDAGVRLAEVVHGAQELLSSERRNVQANIRV